MVIYYKWLYKLTGEENYDEFSKLKEGSWSKL